jgi:hypothetical protein
VALAAGMLALAGCAASGASSSGGAGQPTSVAGAASVSGPAVGTTATLAGTRCQNGRCICRDLNTAPVETPPPTDGRKRFEFRLYADSGVATLESPTIGRFEVGDKEMCFYVDVDAGSTHEVTFSAAEARHEGGVGPHLRVAEYGSKGPFWYDIITVSCEGPGGKCARDAAEDWAVDLKSRSKRGRLDPCGSSVVSQLRWDTSGGAGQREYGLFRDFTVRFSMEVKKFATQFAPGSTECVPK